MSRYSLERKNAVINKFHSDNTLSLSELARQESIPTSTLYNWLKQVNLVGNAMSKKRNSDNWSADVNGNLKLTPFRDNRQSKFDPLDDIKSVN
ncbi:hypothetical protein CJ230_11855 [Oligella urethralis]|uniref:transposase n=1 Tax=Oligella urethralis TaxID=90245 RepID=UPI000C9AE951|nr:transposase [Oligella urethralis]PMC14326.1 hypothetical protein CJ230_11855 [Oligella urethralis]